jgi:hypothetical protein
VIFVTVIFFTKFTDLMSGIDDLPHRTIAGNIAERSLKLVVELALITVDPFRMLQYAWCGSAHPTFVALEASQHCFRMCARIRVEFHFDSRACKLF